MYTSHPSFDLPLDRGSTKVWRYLDFTKFVSLIRERALFFAAPRWLGDPFEGSLTAADIDARTLAKSKRLYEFAGPVGFEMDGLYGDPDPDINYRRVRLEFERAERNRESALPSIESIGVNCWHLSEAESAAMWSIYVRSREGVAIQSTVERLVRAFNHTSVNVHVGVVRYIDYRDSQVGGDSVFERILTKRASFSFEQELRAVCYPITGPGRLVEVDLGELIERVYVSPQARDWFNKLVIGEMTDHGLAAELTAGSSLDDRPLF